MSDLIDHLETYKFLNRFAQSWFIFLFLLANYQKCKVLMSNFANQRKNMEKSHPSGDSKIHPHKAMQYLVYWFWCCKRFIKSNGLNKTKKFISLTIHNNFSKGRGEVMSYEMINDRETLFLSVPLFCFQTMPTIGWPKTAHHRHVHIPL